jgi:enoyl-CoA hydratase
LIATKHVRVGIEGRAGRITLDRPSAINALTLSMIEEIDFALDCFQVDDEVGVVLLDGAGPRGLSAGGDIAALRDSALGDGEGARNFWRAEYRLNARITAYPKPLVAVMDGIVMGGGVGISAHASHRLVTERVQLAMPEVMIGFAPDVGATHLLSRAPGELGTWLALTGARIGAGDVLALDFADRFVRSGELDDLVERLGREEVDGALAAVAAASGPGPAAELADRELADRCFEGDHVERMMRRLESYGGARAEAAAAALQRASPTSLAVTLAALRRAEDLASLKECLAQELRTSCSLMTLPDFGEGVRAVVVDKDREPRWSPSRLEEVDDDEVAAVLRGPDDLEPLWGDDVSAVVGAAAGPAR